MSAFSFIPHLLFISFDFHYFTFPFSQFIAIFFAFYLLFFNNCPHFLTDKSFSKMYFFLNHVLLKYVFGVCVCSSIPSSTNMSTLFIFGLSFACIF